MFFGTIKILLNLMFEAQLILFTLCTERPLQIFIWSNSMHIKLPYGFIILLAFRF